MLNASGKPERSRILIAPLDTRAGPDEVRHEIAQRPANLSSRMARRVTLRSSKGVAADAREQRESLPIRNGRIEIAYDEDAHRRSAALVWTASYGIHRKVAAQLIAEPRCAASAIAEQTERVLGGSHRT